MSRRRLVWASPSVALVVLVACASSTRDRNAFQPSDAGVEATSPFADAGDASGTTQRDPKTCAEAAEQRSYIGCDYWPTITSNIVEPVFDFAVAVANVGEEAANVTVSGNGVNKPTVVAPGSLSIVYLPWVDALKGSTSVGLDESVLVRKGAYHLVSDKPVVVYQFSPLQFRATGGEPGKDWSSCKPEPGVPECYSYSNDASLLLPSTAMTGAYRVMGDFGMSHHPIHPITKMFLTNEPLEHTTATAMTITATADGTNVEIELGAAAFVVGTGGEPPDAGDAGADAGDGGAEAGIVDAAIVDATVDGGSDAAGADANVPINPDAIPTVANKGKLTLKLDAGDVAQIVARKGMVYDFSGSLVIADKPVQVITSVPCQFHPLDTYACDHVEETVFPAETLGQRYVVTAPSGPIGNSVPHFVRVYGNVDGTKLTYKPMKPAGCPDAIEAGQVLDCNDVTTDFEISSDKPFGVGMFMLGGAKVDTVGSATGFPQGDPSQSFAVAVEQYRQKYVFLAPVDYKESFVDIVTSADTTIMLDGTEVPAVLHKPIQGTSFFVARQRLASNTGGVHTLIASKPVGIQVLGYGDNTSFHYPGGLNLAKIAQPPR